MKNKVLTMIDKSNNLDFKKLEVHIFTKKMPEELTFDSGDNDLNDFLYNESIKYCKDNLAVVYLVYYENKLIAFFSLSSDSVKVNKKLEIKLKYYPSLKIGRLAVDTHYQNSGIGSWIIRWIIGFARNVRKAQGIRYISVDAYNKTKVLKFYTNNNFISYGKVKESMENIPMYNDINNFNRDKLL